MICLKTRTFAVSQTTVCLYFPNTILLWFAWKLVLLQYRKQLTNVASTDGFSCDLLENSYFCSIANNYFLKIKRQFALWFAWKLVLLQYRKQRQSPLSSPSNCCDLLENSYFCSIANNRQMLTIWRSELWFAWKLVLLQYRKQPKKPTMTIEECCDLLENSYFCSIANNLVVLHFSLNPVVICLKTRTFAVSQTTWRGRFRLLYKLWFAWKLVLLQYRKQPIAEDKWCAICCDLLENSYFCSIANNDNSHYKENKSVVICLKTRTFAVSQTTVSYKIMALTQLWFAWKLVLLQYRKQPLFNMFETLIGCDLLENSYFCSIANNG